MKSCLKPNLIGLFLSLLLVPVGQNLSFAQVPEFVKDLNTYPREPSTNGFASDDQFLYFRAETPEAGRELFRSDGTPNGTGLFLDLIPGPDSSSPNSFTTLSRGDGTKLIFFLAQHPTFGGELWRTDGTAAGTFVIDINPGLPGSNVSRITPFGDKIIFSAIKAGEGREVWISDGTVQGTEQISNIGAGSANGFSTGSGAGNQFLVINPFSPSRTAFFVGTSNGSQFFKTQGTLASTTKITSFSSTQTSFLIEAFTGNATTGIFFSAKLVGGKEELHVLNVNTNAVSLVKQIGSALDGSQPQDLVMLGNKLIFTAKTTTEGREVWVSDGTDAGTKLLADIVPGPLSPFESVSFSLGFDAAGGFAYFSPDNEETAPFGIFRTDGTPAGTIQLASDAVADIQRGSLKFIDFSSQVFFVARRFDLGGELFTSDGTPSGTRAVTDLLSGPGSSFSFIGSNNFTRFKSANFLLADSDTGRGLFINNGTLGGSALIKNLSLPGNSSSFPTKLDFSETKNGVVFAASTKQTGQEMFVTDGTAAGTTILGDFNPGEQEFAPGPLGILNGTLLLAGRDPLHGTELWKSDGTPSGTQLVTDVRTGSASFLNNNNLNFRNVILPSQEILFAGNDGVHGIELWKSNGTADGTKLVKDINPGASGGLTLSGAGPQGVLFNGVVLFGATSNLVDFELWRTDGTEAGTARVVDIVPGPNGSFPSEFTLFQDKIFFSASGGFGVGTELWTTDGTEAGTKLFTVINPPLGSGPRRLAVFGSKLLFEAIGPNTGFEPFVTDGTPEGTKMLKDINPGGDDSNISDFVVAGDRAYFTAFEGTHGLEMWVTDGTPEGTTLLKDIKPGIGSSFPNGLIEADGKLFFTADEVNNGFLFQSDGTTEGTVPVFATSGSFSAFGSPIFSRGTLFFGGFDEQFGTELFKIVLDACPDNLAKKLPGVCGCSIADSDANSNGIVDCQANLELKTTLSELSSLLKQVKAPKNKKQAKKQRALKASIKGVLARANQLTTSSPFTIQTTTGKSISSLIAALQKKANRALNLKAAKFKKNKKAAVSEVGKVSGQII